VMFPAFPTGITCISGAKPSASITSKDAVFLSFDAIRIY